MNQPVRPAQFTLGLVEPEAPESEPTDAQLAAWWAREVNPTRVQTAERWGAKVQPLALDAKRRAKLRDLLAERWPGDPWSELEPRLRHVLRAVVASVDQARGRRTPPTSKCPQGWNSLDALKPDHWLRPSNFDRYLAAPLPAAEARQDAPRPKTRREVEDRIDRMARGRRALAAVADEVDEVML